jgi:hypothetical protein
MSPHSESKSPHTEFTIRSRVHHIGSSAKIKKSTHIRTRRNVVIRLHPIGHECVQGQGNWLVERVEVIRAIEITYPGPADPQPHPIPQGGAAQVRVLFTCFFLPAVPFALFVSPVCFRMFFVRLVFVRLFVSPGFFSPVFFRLFYFTCFFSSGCFRSKLASP